MKAPIFGSAVNALAGLMLCLSASGVLAEPEPRAADVESALTEFLAGAGTNDPSIHDRFWAEQLVYTSSSGERFGKAEIMAGFDEQNESAESERAAPVYSAENVQIRFELELALLTFTLIAENPSESGRTIQRYYNSGVLKNSAGEDEPPHWQAVLWQATRIPESAAETAPQHERQ